MHIKLFLCFSSNLREVLFGFDCKNISGTVANDALLAGILPLTGRVKCQIHARGVGRCGPGPVVEYRSWSFLDTQLWRHPLIYNNEKVYVDQGLDLIHFVSREFSDVPSGCDRSGA